MSFKGIKTQQKEGMGSHKDGVSMAIHIFESFSVVCIFVLYLNQNIAFTPV